MNVKAGLCTGLLLVTLTLAGIGKARDVEVTTGTFRDMNRVETELRRGVSTKEDVRRLFGEPNGDGGAFFPTAKMPNDVWYYEDIKAEMGGTETGGIMRMDMDWQVLVIFFEEERFDGFLWFTSAQEVKREPSK